MNFFTAFHKEFLEQRRTKRLMIAVTILVLFGITSPLMAKMMPAVFAMIPGAEAIATIIPTPTAVDAVAQYLKNITQFGVILALLFGMGSVALEKDKGTAIMVLSKPMPRGSFPDGKICSHRGHFRHCPGTGGWIGLFLHRLPVRSYEYHWLDHTEWTSTTLSAALYSPDTLFLHID